MLYTNSTDKCSRIEARSRSSLILFGFVPIGILSLGMCLIATAYAQQDATATPMPLPATSAGGWWSPDRSESTLVIPQLELSTASLIRRAVPGAATASWTREREYSIRQYMNGRRPDEAGFELLDTGAENAATLIKGQFLPGSFFSFLNAKYVSWEASLSDSRPLTRVNGALVYPLMEIDYSDWRLPVTLYIPPLRGSTYR